MKVQYWHPSHGGWHVGDEVERNEKVVTIRPNEKARKLMQVPLSDVRAIEGKAA